VKKKDFVRSFEREGRLVGFEVGIIVWQMRGSALQLAACNECHNIELLDHYFW
jgi:hypothetical protein